MGRMRQDTLPLHSLLLPRNRRPGEAEQIIERLADVSTDVEQQLRLLAKQPRPFPSEAAVMLRQMGREWFDAKPAKCIARANFCSKLIHIVVSAPAHSGFAPVIDFVQKGVE